MAGPIYLDRAQETTATTGTGTYTLAGAVTGFQSFAGVGNGNTCYYAITDGVNWEVGLGTYATSGTTLARTTVVASSNANAAVSWATGSKNVWVTSPALFFLGLVTSAGAFGPSANDGKALGTGTLAWSDLFLATGGVINFGNGDVRFTHSSGIIDVTGAVDFNLGTTTSLTTGTIEVGSGNDTTITRALGGGQIAVEGIVVPTISSTVTLTNKRITPRVTSIASSATPAVNSDNCDAVDITALATAITSMTTSLTGTPTNFQNLTYRIKDNGTGRAISWGAAFVPLGVALPTTTVANKILSVWFVYNTATSTWGCVDSAQEA